MHLEVPGDTVRGGRCAHLGSFYEWHLGRGVLVTHGDARGHHRHTKEPCHNLDRCQWTTSDWVTDLLVKQQHFSYMGYSNCQFGYIIRFIMVYRVLKLVGYIRVGVHGALAVPCLGASFLPRHPGHSAATGATTTHHLQWRRRWQRFVRHTGVRLGVDIGSVVKDGNAYRSVIIVLCHMALTMAMMAMWLFKGRL